MGELMWQQIAADECGFPRRKIFRRRSIVAGTLMFDSPRRETIAERKQEIIVIEMPRTKKLVGLPHKLAMNFHNFGSRIEKSRFIRNHVQRHTRTASGIEIDFPEILARNERRVREDFERYGFEVDRGAILG